MLNDQNTDATGVPGSAGQRPAEVTETGAQRADLEAVYDIPVQVSAVLGRATLEVEPPPQARPRRCRGTRSQGRRGDRYLRQQSTGGARWLLWSIDRLGVTMTGNRQGRAGLDDVAWMIRSPPLGMVAQRCLPAEPGQEKAKNWPVCWRHCRMIVRQPSCSAALPPAFVDACCRCWDVFAGITFGGRHDVFFASFSGGPPLVRHRM